MKYLFFVLFILGLSDCKYITDNDSCLFCIIFNGKIGFINSKGKEVILPQYNNVGNFSEGLIAVTVYGNIRAFKEGLAVASRIDTNHSVSHGLREETEDAVIDTTGKIVVPYGKYETINDFSEGFALVVIKSLPDDIKGYSERT